MYSYFNYFQLFLLLHQAVKGMTAVEASFKKDGVIIMLAACNDGHGGESLYEILKNAKTPREFLDRIAKGNLINHLLKTIGNLW